MTKFDSEQKKAQDLLRDPKLLTRLVHEVQKEVAGEEAAIKTILLCTSGRIVVNSQESSYNLIIHAKSGAGKDKVVESTLAVHPDGIVEARKTISPKVWTYWHNTNVEPDWTWDGIIFYGEDLPNRVLNDEVMKLMASSGNGVSTIVVNGKAVNIKVVGKPVMIITSASANLNRENLRRYTVCPLDESIAQTKKIKQRLSLQAICGGEKQPVPYIKNAMSMSQRVSVKVLFAKKVENVLPNNLIIRTVYGRFLDYIKASAALYQFQRTKTKNGTVIATWKDYDIAREAILHTTSNNSMIPLSGVDKEIWEVMEDNEPGRHDGWFSTDFIATEVPEDYRTVMNHLNQMTRNDLLKKSKDKETTEEEKRRGRPSLIWKPKRTKKLILPKAGEI